MDAIYLDFAKAFDTVPHQRLLKKLEAYVTTCRILTWIKGFLSDRIQVVKANGEESTSAPVLSGIPQGSVLGPLMFVIHINDLPEVISSNAFLFADDTKVLRHITSREDSIALQSDIDLLNGCSKKWLLKFNTDKCQVIPLGKFENIMHTHELEHVFEEKDLGVIIDCDLKFEQNMSAKVKKTNAIVGFIRQSFSYLDCALSKKLFTTFVRPHLEYAQTVSSPHLQKHINIIENSPFGVKFSDPKTGQKHFWTAYKKITNKKVNTNIPPIIENGVYISNCKQKSVIFNQYFANQCTINETDASLSHVSVTKSQIVNIINNFNSNKAHGCGGISVAMLKR